MPILLFGGKANSGKGYVSDIFKSILENEYNKKVLTISFGDLLKFYCNQYFNWNGLKDTEGRTLLQYIGNDVVRDKKPDYWAMSVVNFLLLFIDNYDFVLIADWRYPNELNCILQYFAGRGIFTFWIQRDSYTTNLTKSQVNHISENSITSDDCDYVINNNEMIDLKANIQQIIKNILQN